MFYFQERWTSEVKLQNIKVPFGHGKWVLLKWVFLEFKPSSYVSKVLNTSIQKDGATNSSILEIKGNANTNSCNCALDQMPYKWSHRIP